MESMMNLPRRAPSQQTVQPEVVCCREILTLPKRLARWMIFQLLRRFLAIPYSNAFGHVIFVRPAAVRWPNLTCHQEGFRVIICSLQVVLRQFESSRTSPIVPELPAPDLTI
eukprot:764422-Hanusia_phi.AAC.1